MKLSMQSQHAIMAMLALAVHDEEGAMRLGDIAQQQGISLSYLEQIFARLRQEELVEGIRGPGGGYRLARAADEITLADIAIAVEDQDDEIPKRTLDKPEQKVVESMWQSLSDQLHDFLSDITLAQMLEKHHVTRRKSFRIGETASMIARMFLPARANHSPIGYATAM
jgi:Rrf2 family iron-sulfur cluster assembly transcriptional regulator